MYLRFRWVARLAARVVLATAGTYVLAACGLDPNDASVARATTATGQSPVGPLGSASDGIEGPRVEVATPTSAEGQVLEGDGASAPETEGDVAEPAPLPPLRPGERRFPSITEGETVSWVPDDCVVDVELEVDGIECGWLIVPVDRSTFGGDRAELPVMIVRSAEADAGATPVVYLAGGPGQSALDEFDDLWLSTGLDLAARDRDVVVFDQRGVGNAVPAVRCSASTRIVETGWGAIADDDAVIELFAGCRDELSANGIDPAMFSVADSASDVVDLRIALGFDRWHVYGSSYGTRLALSVERQDPDGVESLVLDSVYPAGVSLTSSASAGFDRSIAVLNQYCERDVACADEFGDLIELSDQLLAGFAERRVPDFGGLPVLFRDDAVVEEVLFSFLYDETVIGEIPHIMRRLLDRSPAALDLFSFVRAEDIGDRALFWAVMCSSDVPLAEPDRKFTPATGGGSALLFSSRRHEMCEAFGVTGLSPGVEAEPLVPEVPTLVFAGEFDPITPPDWGRRLAADAAQGRYVETVGGGHAGAGVDYCTANLIRQFLSRPSQPVIDNCDPVELVFVTSGLEGVELFTATRFLETELSSGEEPQPVGLSFDLYESWLVEVVPIEETDPSGPEALLLTPNRLLTDEVIVLSLYGGPAALSDAMAEVTAIGGVLETERVVFGDAAALRFSVPDSEFEVDAYLMEIPDSDWVVMAIWLGGAFNGSGTARDKSPSLALSALLSSLEVI